MRNIFLLLALLLYAAPSLATPLDIDYRLSVENAQEHLYRVEIAVKRNKNRRLEFVMPAWSPGRYAIYDFARNVQEFAAETAKGEPLAWRKLDKQTWQIDATESLTVRYLIYANNLSGTFSQVNETHANYNGASVFMYVQGHKQNPVSLTIAAPKGWRVINGAVDALGQTSFRFDNYDLLIDTPTEVGDFKLAEFEHRGRVYRVALHALADFDRMTELVESIRKIVVYQTSIFGDPDFKHYTFILHLVSPSGPSDGMEHLNSTQVIGRNLEDLVETCSHEFFHLWNVKRLRPAGIGPWDYTREVYTRSLWISEGLTSFYGDISLARSQVWTRSRYYHALAQEVMTLQSRPARRFMSLELSSWDTWLFLGVGHKQETNQFNSTISYYNKGHLVGLLLDLEIRHCTGSRRSLDDVFRDLYERFYLKAPRESYYLKGRGFKDEDFLEAASRAAGKNLSDFFRSYVSGTEELDYQKYLSYAGLKLVVTGEHYSIQEDAEATAEQKELRDLWLKGQVKELR